MENNQQPNTIGGFAPGNYLHKECKTCKKEFIGHKRAVQCEPCAINELNLESISSTELSPELKQLINDNWDYLIDTGITHEEPGKYFADNADMTIIIERPNKITYTEDEVRGLLIKALTHNDDKLYGSLVTVQKEIRTANFNVWFEENKKK